MNTPLFVTTVFIQSFSFLCKKMHKLLPPPPTPSKQTHKQTTIRNSLIKTGYASVDLFVTPGSHNTYYIGILASIPVSKDVRRSKPVKL